MPFCLPCPEGLSSYVTFLSDLPLGCSLLMGKIITVFPPHMEAGSSRMLVVATKKTTKPTICIIQSSFVASTVFLVRLIVNESGFNFALFRLPASRNMPVGHIVTDPENFAN